MNPLETGKLRIVPLGGQDGIGEKNMIVIEYGDDALVLDCGPLVRKYHQDVALEQGIPRKNIIMANNGDVIELGERAWPRVVGQVTAGSVSVDQTGVIVPGVVTKDRLMLRDDGIVVVIVTVHKTTGRLLTSPDVISRGFIYLRDNAELIEGLHADIRKFTAKHCPQQRQLDTYKKELRDLVSTYLYKHVGRSPLIVPVVNTIYANGKSNVKLKPMTEVC